MQQHPARNSHQHSLDTTDQLFKYLQQLTAWCLQSELEQQQPYWQQYHWQQCGWCSIDSTSSNADLYSNYVCFNGFDVNNQGASNNGTLDSCDTFASWIEDGHLGCEFACSSFWHRFFGDTNGTTTTH